MTPFSHFLVYSGAFDLTPVVFLLRFRLKIEAHLRQTLENTLTPEIQFLIILSSPQNNKYVDT